MRLSIKIITPHFFAQKQFGKRGIKTTASYLKMIDNLAAPFAEGLGFCLKKSITYREKTHVLLAGQQFSKIDVTKRRKKPRKWLLLKKKMLMVLS